VTPGDSYLFGSPLSACSTNVVLDASTKTAFSFRYGFRQLERRVVDVYQHCGWKLVWINRSLLAASHLLAARGGLRCLCGEWE
jgi:hypothetical protein